MSNVDTRLADTTMLQAEGSKTRSITTYTLARALIAAEEFMGGNCGWNGTNGVQEDFLTNFFLPNEALSIEEIETKASQAAAELNKFLKENGFDIELEELGPNEFGAVSILDQLVYWLEKGEKVPIYTDQSEYPGVQLKKGVSAHEVPGHNYPVVSIETKNKEENQGAGKAIVHMTILDDPPSGFDLISKTMGLKNGGQFVSCDEVQFPMIDLNLQGELDWVVGMATQATNGQDWSISKGIQQTKFRMDEVGARVQDAVAITLERCCSMSSRIVIDKPFLLWITKEDLLYPTFTAFLDTDVWSKPTSVREM
jgi:hypothetical protein